jgi:hypothetical protein
MGKAEIRTIRVPRWVTVVLLLLVSAAMGALIYALSGRAYTPERGTLVDVVAALRRGDDRPVTVLAVAAPFIADILFFLPWGAIAFLAIDREGQPLSRSYSATVLVGVAFALSLAVWQRTLPTRVTGGFDVLWNAVGCLAGAIVGHMRKRVRIRFE